MEFGATDGVSDYKFTTYGHMVLIRMFQNDVVVSEVNIPFGAWLRIESQRRSFYQQKVNDIIRKPEACKPESFTELEYQIANDLALPHG